MIAAVAADALRDAAERDPESDYAPLLVEAAEVIDRLAHELVMAHAEIARLRGWPP